MIEAARSSCARCLCACLPPRARACTRNYSPTTNWARERGKNERHLALGQLHLPPRPWDTPYSHFLHRTCRATIHPLPSSHTHNITPSRPVSPPLTSTPPLHHRPPTTTHLIPPPAQAGKTALKWSPTPSCPFGVPLCRMMIASSPPRSLNFCISPSVYCWVGGDSHFEVNTVTNALPLLYCWIRCTGRLFIIAITLRSEVVFNQSPLALSTTEGQLALGLARC